MTRTTPTETARFTAETAGDIDFSNRATPMTEMSFVKSAANLLRSLGTAYAFERAAEFERAGLARAAAAAAARDSRNTDTRW